MEAIVDDGGPAFLAQVLNVYKDKSPLTCQENYRVKKKNKNKQTNKQKKKQRITHTSFKSVLCKSPDFTIFGTAPYQNLQ